MISQKLRDARAHGPSVLRARWYLRRADHLGSKVRVQGRPKVVNRGRLIIGDRVRLSSTIATLELFVAPGGTLEIGDGAFINVGTSIAATERVVIGANALIGPHCMLLDNAFHHLEPERRYEVPPSAPIVLESNVWLGGRVIVLPGVRIGHDSAVAAGSVVTADVPPRTLVGGVPAKVIREL
jgi:maltose O-acetyltransferase